MNRELLEKPFDRNQIKQREGNFGKMLDYIEGHAVVKRLNDSFEANWSFAILKHEILRKNGRISAKQHKYILDIIKDLGMRKSDINQQCVQAYGSVLDHISRQDASSLINELLIQ